jgi:hypothetical protein
MMKIYVINNKKYWYEEGTQPSNAIELKKEVKKEVTKEVQEKVVEPKNKVVKTTKRK